MTFCHIYDGACGTGGMLTVAEGRMQEVAKEFGKNVSIHLYGQENSDETYAIARSDMLVKGEGVQANNIFFGSTISNDGFAGETFDFMLSNPPFGTPWKTDLKAWGDIKNVDRNSPHLYNISVTGRTLRTTEYKNVQTYFMRVGIVRHGIGALEVPNCSTTPLVLLAGVVQSRTRL